MKKNIVQDVLPPKKSIRNLELTSRSKSLDSDIRKETLPKKEDLFTRPVSINKQAPMKIEPATENKEPPLSDNNYKYEYVDSKKSSKKWVYFTTFFVVLLLAFGVSALFRSAEIKVTPKQEMKSVDGTFAAKYNATGNILGFQIETVTKELEKTIPGTGLTNEQKVEKKARGSIVIYNNYSSESQRLVATTRFETPEGLIYRLISPVTIPGTQTKEGKVVAGSVEVIVEADKAGAEYNVGLKDFTIPGFKGDPKYTKVYARSKTDMTGGFLGNQKVVPKEILDKANEELEISLKDSLSKDIETQIPTDFVLYKNSISHKFEPATQTTTASGDILLKKRGVTTGVIFDKGSLTRAVLSKVLPNAGDEMIKITNLENLDFQPELPVSGLNTAQTINFSLKGEADLVWVFDENKLKTDLLGLSKNNANAVIGTYKAVKEAWVTTHPFWNRNIPSDPEKVTFINTLTLE